MKHLNKILLVALAATMFSCDDDFEHPVEDFQVTKGDADFSKYIALGNSLTSGYRDNALYHSGQENSYPNMLAGLMKAAGGGEFKIPYMPNDTGGFTDTDIPGYPGKLVLQIVNGSLSPVPTAAGGALDNIAAAGPYQNMGVPGAKSYHLAADGYGNAAYVRLGKANPYFSRFASSGTTSVVKDAVAQNPTFFSLWIGNNDVLSYATSGGLGVDHNETNNVDPTTYNPLGYDITNANVVKASINGILKAMTAKGAKGVIANIPSVTSIPYFTTVPATPITGLADAQVTALMSAQAYGSYNAGLGQAKAAGLLSDAEYQERLIKFTAGATINGAVIVDKDLTNLAALGLPSYRQTTSKDLIVLTAASLLPKGYGTQIALEDKYVLTAKETAKAEAAVTKYNAAIAELATAYNLAFVDTHAQMQRLSSASGIKFYGQTYTTTFVSGGAFSLDGVHLTGNGYAIVANMFVDAINQKYHSTLRKVYPGDYPGIAIP
ncbi:G-D-S-L family lipolytic protein [Algoriella sp.]|uniref:G-D-S-L family lipolytic protein n=1 Tax=Algoriella sp. TaxID=1872434 RepID=UPI001B2EDADE|nr:G-D-S-L family lipolytic protein [Algoriella sp.]MBO6212544.1 G-D-S-L family lipolytic protein [Algoriella sp.]